MRSTRRNVRPFALFVTLVGIAFAAVPRHALADVEVRFVTLDGYESPGTPPELNKVGILQIGSAKARNVLVLNPGTSASAAYFAPLAKTVVELAPLWQVWAVERRENLLEDHSALDQAKDGSITGQELFDYYLGWLSNPNIMPHFALIPDADVAFARDWGMKVEIEDLHRVVKEAKKHGRRVVVGGHSLGGSITTAYATWDFRGKAGARKLRGLVYIDGGSSPVPITPEDATTQLQALQSGSPWLSFGGIPAPFAGLFNATGSMGVFLDPDGPSIGQASPLIPANLKPPVPATNLAQYGYALDTETSPPGLIAAQAHLGKLADSGDPRGWDQAGEITPILRYAEMFSGKGLQGLDGTAWYHPQRLTLALPPCQSIDQYLIEPTDWLEDAQQEDEPGFDAYARQASYSPIERSAKNLLRRLVKQFGKGTWQRAVLEVSANLPGWAKPCKLELHWYTRRTKSGKEEPWKIKRFLKAPLKETRTDHLLTYAARSDFAASLERGKAYRCTATLGKQFQSYVRITDESGEEYWYPERFFVPNES